MAATNALAHKSFTSAILLVAAHMLVTDNCYFIGSTETASLTKDTVHVFDFKNCFLLLLPF